MPKLGRGFNLFLITTLKIHKLRTEPFRTPPLNLRGKKLNRMLPAAVQFLRENLYQYFKDRLLSFLSKPEKAFELKTIYCKGNNINRYFVLNKKSLTLPFN